MRFLIFLVELRSSLGGILYRKRDSERLMILEGVVDGGDEVEDQLTERQSSSRVRYGPAVNVGGQEKELSPSSEVIDAYSRPPAYKAVDKRFPDSSVILLCFWVLYRWRPTTLTTAKLTFVRCVRWRRYQSSRRVPQ